MNLTFDKLLESFNSMPIYEKLLNKRNNKKIKQKKSIYNKYIQNEKGIEIIIKIQYINSSIHFNISK